MKRFLIFIALLLASMSLQAGELKFGWNLANEAGGIQDMKFMPNQDQFILTTTGNEMQIRKTADGELIQKYPGIEGFFEFTPDSNRIVVASWAQTKGAKIELRKLNDMSLIIRDSIELKADTLDPVYNTKLNLYFLDMKLDPIRPYAYLILQKTNNIAFPNVDTTRIIVYNYETMKQIADLTPEVTETIYFNLLAVSKDGKYLAAMNQGKTYLKVWDLEKMELKRDFCLYDKNLQFDYSCTPRDLKFSELNTDNIYLCGDFPRLIEDNNLLGFSIYNILENKIIDSTFSSKPKQVYSFGQFAFFDKEERIIIPNSMFVNIINLKSKEIEATYNISFELPFSNIKYSKKNNLFLGFYSQYFGMASYNNGSLIKEEILENKIIYPNPTTNIINIELNCFELNRFYEVYTYNGIIITKSEIESNNSIFQIDLSNYPSATYYLKVTCGSDSQTYKVIKEN